MLYFAPWKIVAIVIMAIVAVVFALPNAFDEEDLASLPGFLPKQQIVLGLDLQGGAHLLLQVERDSLVEDRLEAVRDDVRRTLRDERIGYTGLGTQGQAVQLRIRDLDRLEEAETLLNAIATPVDPLSFGGQAPDVDVEVDADGLTRLTLTDDGITQRLSQAVEQSIEVIRRRIDQLGTTEPTIQREGQDRVLVQVPGLDDPQRLKDLLQQTAALSFHLLSDEMSPEEAMRGRAPIGTDLLMSLDDPPIPYLVQSRALITGDQLADAQPGFDQQTQEPIVQFRFNTAGATAFGQATTENVGRPFAIVLDDEVISAPVIREPILGGSGQISGGFSAEGANDLAILLRAGALPADLTIVEERTVGPGLGADSIAAGQVAGIIGAIGVLVFMALSYGMFGLFANVALIINVSLILAALSILGATLTLPGIAGIVLTVGMAVDSNVLIFERIREEVRRGRKTIAAIDVGFKEALRTILDANITTLIAAVILFQLGSGPVRGFAVTLAIGIVSTVFTAYTLTRLLIALWVRSRRPTALPI
ncbi:MAG: protein translocase subunit SecD [Devosiaceae bacterium]|nr:protein translocase subunit SecD [Devosiaceae bacterium MH13]